MKTPGITVRPIINIELHDEFCEVFFDNVRVPKENLVGQLNKGWDMAKALLGFERIFIGAPRQSAYALSRLRMLAERMGVWEDPDFQDRYARLRLDLQDLKALYGTHVAKLKRVERLRAHASTLKVIKTELFQHITDTMLEIGGENAGLPEPMAGDRRLNIGGLNIQARPTTVCGGWHETQGTPLRKTLLGRRG